MRRILLLAGLGAVAAAGVAYAAGSVTNNYAIQAVVKPTKSGTSAHPVPVKVRVAWTVSTSPKGLRPANVRGYKISLEGLDEHTIDFPACGTTTLNDSGPNSCLPGSLIGGGRFIIEAGPSGVSDSNYNAECRAEISIYNGGNHNLTLWIYKGSQRAGQPAPCPIPNGGVAVNDGITHSKHGITEHFSFPLELLHLVRGVDSTVINAVLGIPAHTRLVQHRHGHKTTRTEVGLIESVSCPANHQRQVTITFTREDGVANTRTTSVPCT